MKIGELSHLTGVSVRSLRHYEKKGLIASVRLPNGYRDYSPLTTETVDTIKLYLNLGLTTEQIAAFLTCVLKNKEAFCAEVLPVYRKKLADIEHQLKQLDQIKTNLIDRINSLQQEEQVKNE
ncbi:MerR family transcriptional regulator [Candidatus Pristimantibacillus sp. PTI5]|uniref:MerR family transcriptional regulator n=1 Tax=Candidatus Pristimantibacillus sp. PTI5 TaxID=3400422 RepID=UPI003B0179EE